MCILHNYCCRFQCRLRYGIERLHACKIPLQAHNDTKHNNFLIGGDMLEDVRLIDSGTAIPCLSIYDFGSPICFNVNHNTECKKELSKYNFDNKLNERYAHGFLRSAQVSIAKVELGYLHWSTKLMAREYDIRLLTDCFVCGNHFCIRYPVQNLTSVVIKLHWQRI